MDPTAAYRESSITARSKEQLIVMLYDGAIKFLRQAIIAMENQDYEQKGKLLVKAMDIIDELDCCLDMELGGEVAENLRRLYDFMRRHLTEANIKLDAHRIRDVIACLDDLNEGWKAIAGQGG